MIEYTNDPLGLEVKGRARENRLRQSLQGLMPIGGPLPDPNWDAYFQTMDDQEVAGIQAGESPEGSTQLRGFGSDQIVNRKGFSQAPLAGLRAAVTPPAPAPMPQSHETFMKGLNTSPTSDIKARNKRKR